MTRHGARPRRRWRLKALLRDLDRQLVRVSRQLDGLRRRLDRAAERRPAPVVRASVAPSPFRDARHRLGWSQRQLARAAGVSQPSVIRLEQGRPVSAPTKQKILGAFLRAGLVVDADGRVALPNAAGAPAG